MEKEKLKAQRIFNTLFNRTALLKEILSPAIKADEHFGGSAMEGIYDVIMGMLDDYDTLNEMLFDGEWLESGVSEKGTACSR